MSNQFPKLQANLDEIQERFNEILETEFKSKGIEDVEIRISMSNFAPLSLQTQAVSSLIGIVNDSKITGNANSILKKHVLAAASLLKMKRYKKPAMSLLIKAITNTVLPEVPELAAKALGEFSREVEGKNFSLLGCDKNGNCTFQD